MRDRETRRGTDEEAREISRAFKAGDGTLKEKVLNLVMRGVLPEEDRERALAYEIGLEIERNLTHMNGKRKARIVDFQKLGSEIDLWIQGGHPSRSIRGGRPPRQRLLKEMAAESVVGVHWMPAHGRITLRRDGGAKAELIFGVNEWPPEEAWRIKPQAIQLTSLPNIPSGPLRLWARHASLGQPVIGGRTEQIIRIIGG